MRGPPLRRQEWIGQHRLWDCSWWWYISGMSGESVTTAMSLKHVREQREREREERMRFGRLYCVRQHDQLLWLVPQKRCAWSHQPKHGAVSTDSRRSMYRSYSPYSLCRRGVHFLVRDGSLAALPAIHASDFGSQQPINNQQ